MSDGPDFALLRAIEDRASWLSVYQVHWANHKPENEGQKPKVGGHQASVTSSSTLLSALYLHIKRPQDRVAVKPHAAPFLYALMYLMGRVDQPQMASLREFRGLQPYPTQHSNPDFVDYSTSIEGLGVAATIEDAYVAQVQADQLGIDPGARFHAHCGDGELTELQIGGSLHEAGRRRLGAVTWWVDVNRQSLDRIMEDSPHGSVAAWAKALFEANGWHVVEARWGAHAEAAFSASGGDALRDRLESLGDAHYQPLLLVPPDVLKMALLGQTGHGSETFEKFLTAFKASAPLPKGMLKDLKAAIGGMDPEDVRRIVADLGGHDMARLLACDAAAQAETGRPTAILCHTIKGWRLPSWEGHPENHGALLSEERLKDYRAALAQPEGDPWQPFPETAPESAFLKARANFLFPPGAGEAIPYPTHLLPSEEDARILYSGTRSTSAAFGQLNTRYLKSDLGPYLHFIAPDVGLTTNLGGVITTTGVYEHNDGAGVNLAGFLIDEKKAAFAWRLTREGHFHSVAINEGVAAMKLYAFGRRHMKTEGAAQYIAIGTIYDIFWKHAYTQLYYGLYDNARFIAVGTPSGTSLSRESGTHQSIQTPALLMGLPGIVAFEPAYGFETAVLYRWAIEQLGAPEGESVYLRLSTQDLLQPFERVKGEALEDRGLPADLPILPTQGPEGDALKAQIIEGAYWIYHPALAGALPPHYNPRLLCHLYATGPLMEEALKASRILAEEHGVYAPVLNVLSYDKLYRGWRAHWGEDAAATGAPGAGSFHLSELIPDAEWGAPTVAALDGHPMTADWLGSALGRPVRVLGPTTFSEVGAVAPLRRHHGIDADAMVTAALRELAAG